MLPPPIRVTSSRATSAEGVRRAIKNSGRFSLPECVAFCADGKVRDERYDIVEDRLVRITTTSEFAGITPKRRVPEWRRTAPEQYAVSRAVTIPSSVELDIYQDGALTHQVRFSDVSGGVGARATRYTHRQLWPGCRVGVLVGAGRAPFDISLAVRDATRPLLAVAPYERF